MAEPEGAERWREYHGIRDANTRKIRRKLPEHVREHERSHRWNPYCPQAKQHRFQRCHLFKSKE